MRATWFLGERPPRRGRRSRRRRARRAQARSPGPDRHDARWLPLRGVVPVLRPLPLLPWFSLLGALDGFVHDAAAVRHFGGVVRRADLVVKQLALHVADEAGELGRVRQQATLGVELPDALGERAKQAFP